MKKCVFLLEDDTDLRELFTYLLEEDNFEVKSYPTGADFRKGIHQQTPDIFVMDVMLPDGNGLDICQELKNDPKTRAVPIIMMSAHKDIAALKGGCTADDFIEKPMDIHQFLAKVERLTYGTLAIPHTFL